MSASYQPVYSERTPSWSGRSKFRIANKTFLGKTTVYSDVDVGRIWEDIDTSPTKYWTLVSQTNGIAVWEELGNLVGPLVTTGSNGGSNTNGGTSTTTDVPPLTSDTPHSVNSSITSVTLRPANPLRRPLSIYNNSTSTLYVSYSSTAQPSNAKVAIPPKAYWEMPTPIYLGSITGIWDEVNGNASIYEGI